MIGTLTRRSLLSLSTPANDPAERPVLVVVFLRGAADGLALVPPYGDDRLYALRPALAPRPPRDRGASADDRALDLDGFYGLHPRLEPLLPAFREGDLGIVHAVGSDDDTRSHFEAQDRMEQASARGRSSGSGWAARYLRARSSTPGPGLSAVALGTRMPEVLRGAPAVTVLERATDYRLAGDDDPRFAVALRTLYGAAPEPLAAAGLESLRTLSRIATLGAPRPRHGADYPDDRFGRGLSEIAELIRADIGLQVACIDVDGWDTHFVQASALEGPATSLARGLSSFRTDLGADLARVVVLVLTEFGRRGYENSSAGTDHGRASVAFAMGHGVAGGAVHGTFPGLAEDALEPPGDLRVTTDFRDVLAELATGPLRLPDIADLLPGHRPRPLGLFA